MLTTLRNAHDELTACCAWLVVDEHGKLDPQGAYIFVEQLECNPGRSSRDSIRSIIQQIASLAPQAIGAYWERRDKGRKGLRMYFGGRQALRVLAGPPRKYIAPMPRVRMLKYGI